MQPFPSLLRYTDAGACKALCKELSTALFWSFERAGPVNCSAACDEDPNPIVFPDAEGLSLHAHERPYRLTVSEAELPSLTISAPVDAGGTTHFVPVGVLRDDQVIMHFSSIEVHSDHLMLSFPPSGDAEQDAHLEAASHRMDLKLPVEDYVVVVSPPSRPFTSPYFYALMIELLPDSPAGSDQN